MFVAFVARTDCKDKARIFILQIFLQLFFSRTLHFQSHSPLRGCFFSNADAKVVTFFEPANIFKDFFKIFFIPYIIYRQLDAHPIIPKQTGRCSPSRNALSISTRSHYALTARASWRQVVAQKSAARTLATTNMRNVASQPNAALFAMAPIKIFASTASPKR